MLHPSFTAPDYDGKNFSNLPPTLFYWLTGQGAPALAPEVMPAAFAHRYDLVIFLFLDSFGWEFVERCADEYAFLKRFQREGHLVKITAQFPSTTAAHVTCIHTGLPVSRSGVYEWQYYEPKLDAVITPLLFSFAGTMHRDTLKPTGVDPRQLYPTETLYASLAAQGVTSYTFGSREFTPSTYSSVVMRGANMQPYKTFGESVANLAQLAARVETPAYLFLYYGNIDYVCHLYGPDAVQTRVQIDMTLHALEKWLLPNLDVRGKRTLLVLSADHGHMAVTPQDTFYLNLDPRTRDIIRLFKTDARGSVRVPAGSPRDAFLYIRDEELDEAAALLTDALDGYADVVKTGELVARGFFGKPPVCADLWARLGNLTVLPHPNHCVWWYEKDKFEQKYFGHHGSLTPTEMEIPLALLELS